MAINNGFRKAAITVAVGVAVSVVGLLALTCKESLVGHVNLAGEVRANTERSVENAERGKADHDRVTRMEERVQYIGRTVYQIGRQLGINVAPPPRGAYSEGGSQ